MSISQLFSSLPSPSSPLVYPVLQGLTQYNPALPLRHNWLLTHSQGIPRVHTLVSLPAAYESNTYTVALGLDHFYCRSSPARAFDQVDRDFNTAVFLVVIAACGVGAAVLNGIVKRKELQDAWK